MQDNVIEDIGAAADELEDITERLIQSVGVNAVESMMTFRGGRHFLYFIHFSLLVMIGGFATFIVSSLLIHGIRTVRLQNKRFCDLFSSFI